MDQTKGDQKMRGEQFAAEFLTSNGFEIIDRNFRLVDEEIDIIAIETDLYTSEKTVVFLQVTTRFLEEFDALFESMGYHKIRTLIKATQLYKSEHPKLPELMRIDVVSVLLNENGDLLDIELVKNITG